MDVTSKRLVGKASFVRKLTGYYASFRQGKHSEAWGVKAFRVLTVTTSDKRNREYVPSTAYGDAGTRQ